MTFPLLHGVILHGFGFYSSYWSLWFNAFAGCWQTFHVLYHTDNNVLLGAPTGSGKTISAELAMLHLFNTQPDMKVNLLIFSCQEYMGLTWDFGHDFHFIQC